MIFKVFAIYDDKAKAYMQPFLLPENGQAKRAFFDAVNEPTSPIGRHAADYTLFRIGSYNDADGVLTPEVPHATIANGVQLLQREMFENPPLKNGEIPVSMRDG